MIEVLVLVVLVLLLLVVGIGIDALTEEIKKIRILLEKK